MNVLVGALRSVEAEWVNYRETWRGSVFSAFAAPVLYLGAIGFGLGSLVDDGGRDLGVDVDYVTFLAPGLIAATGLQVGTGEAIFGTMARVKWHRTWHTAVSTPLAPTDIALGHLLWCTARGALAALIYALVTVAFGVLGITGSLLAVGPAVLGAAALSAVVMAWLVVADNEHAMNAAQRFVVIPMFLFSGVFFPISQLPGWMQPLARATPLWHSVQLSRSAALDAPPAWSATQHLVVLLAFVAVGLAIATRTFARRLTS